MFCVGRSEKASLGRCSMNRDLNARMEGVSHVNVWKKRIPGTRSHRGTKTLGLEHRLSCNRNTVGARTPGTCDEARVKRTKGRW